MTVIRSLALGEVGVKTRLARGVREATTGMVVGLLVAPIAFGQAMLWKAPVELAITVSVTMFAICVHDCRVADPHSGATFRGGSGGTFRATDYYFG